MIVLQFRLDSVRIESAQRIEQLELQLSEAVSKLHLLEAAVEMDVALDASAPPTVIPVSPPPPAPTLASSTASPSSRSPALPPALRSPASDRRSGSYSLTFVNLYDLLSLAKFRCCVCSGQVGEVCG